MEREAVQVGQMLQLLQVREPLDLVPVQVDHLECNYIALMKTLETAGTSPGGGGLPFQASDSQSLLTLSAGNSRMSSEMVSMSLKLRSSQAMSSGYSTTSRAILYSPGEITTGRGGGEGCWQSRNLQIFSSLSLTFRVHQVVVCQPDDVGVVPAGRRPPGLAQALARVPLLKLVQGRDVPGEEGGREDACISVFVTLVKDFFLKIYIWEGAQYLYE